MRQDQAMFNIGAKLAELQLPGNRSYCDALAIAAPRVQPPLAGGLGGPTGTCPPGSLRLGYVGKFVQLCNLTMYYCGNCSRAPQPQ